MNERIKQLAKQTGYIWHASGDPQIYEFTPEKLEKFAELIVRECVSTLGCEIVYNDNYTEKNKIISDMMELLKQHFGVES
jgi:predicted site-specific integrase-resolvase